MSVLVACEFSGKVTDALRAKGLDAWSCDLLPSEGTNPQYHIQGDVVPLLSEKWDAMIAFPPCTDLSGAGARHWKQKQVDGRQQASIEFFMRFINADIPLIAVENPRGIMSTVYRKPDQYVQPYEHGHLISKATGLWLKGLPKIIPTNLMDKTLIPRHTFSKGKRKGQSTPYFMAMTSGGKARSIFWDGIAKAFADQWYPYLTGEIILEAA